MLAPQVGERPRQLRQVRMPQLRYPRHRRGGERVQKRLIGQAQASARPSDLRQALRGHLLREHQRRELGADDRGAFSLQCPGQVLQQRLRAAAPLELLRQPASPRAPPAGPARGRLLWASQQRPEVHRGPAAPPAARGAGG